MPYHLATPHQKLRAMVTNRTLYWQQKGNQSIEKVMEIVHIAAEFAPVAKVGGLADMLFGLAKAHLEMKQHVEIILPKYATLNLAEVEDLKLTIPRIDSFFSGKQCHNSIWKAKVHGIALTLIETHDLCNFFKRESIYGFADDTDRFAYFAKAALEYLSFAKKNPDILHLHDWHAALAAFLYEGAAKKVLTIHNLAYEGKAPGDLLNKLGLKNTSKEMINLLEMGIIHSDFVTTVSPTYAKEILLEYTNHPLALLLQKNPSKFTGIVNGIDYAYWNPSQDPLLKFPFSSHDFSGKKKLQTHLRKTLALSQEERPIVSAITRLVPQKGPHLIKQALWRALELGGQCILIGSPDDERSFENFANLKRALDGSNSIYIELGFNENLAHLVYGASDLFLVPSIFEPCGLTQLIAMRYGALPLVRKTGGLADTVADGVNGFVFEEPSFEAILAAIDRAFDIWHHKRPLWETMRLNAMQGDHSWKKPAESYLELYQKLREFLCCSEQFQT